MKDDRPKKIITSTFKQLEQVLAEKKKEVKSKKYEPEAKESRSKHGKRQE
jgi:hypothetical protein